MSRFSIDGSDIRLHREGLLLATAKNEVTVDFSFPVLGRPVFPAGSGATVRVLGPPAISAAGDAASESAGIVVEALRGRVGMSPVGGGNVVELTAEPIQGPAGRIGFALTGSPAERQLYDIALRADDGSWTVVAPHAVDHRSGWSDFGLAHVTDTHVARRIDRFREALTASGLDEAAARLINWNNRFRGFVRYANLLHEQGELDLIVVTGDLVDDQYEADDDPDGSGNALFLRQLILGQAPRAADDPGCSSRCRGRPPVGLSTGAATIRSTRSVGAEARS